MGAYKHFRNTNNPGVTIFVTTTVLDFVHAFRRDEMRDAMAYHLARECKLARVALYGFVVMPHHIHMVARLPERLTGPAFMRGFKSHTAGAMLPLLTCQERHEFDQQRGLNRRLFWKDGFRSIEIVGEPMFCQKMAYVHQNPVRAGYVVDAEAYRWSSARFLIAGQWSRESGLDYEPVMTSLGTWRDAIGRRA